MSQELYHDRVTTDWKGELYAGINLEWNYEKRWVKARMKRVCYKTPTKIQPQNAIETSPQSIQGGT